MQPLFACCLSSLLSVIPPFFNFHAASQVKAAVAAVGNTRGMSWPPAFEQHRPRSGDLDLFDWLRAMFGFQV